MFSKACEYGIKATLAIAQHSDEMNRISLKEVAKEIDSPVAFTAKILQILANKGIIQSSKGMRGGYHIDQVKKERLTLMDIVNAIDGDKLYNDCGLGLYKCGDDKPCPMHHQFITVKMELRHMLENATLEFMSDELNKGAIFLKS